MNFTEGIPVPELWLPPSVTDDCCSARPFSKHATQCWVEYAFGRMQELEAERDRARAQCKAKDDHIEMLTEREKNLQSALAYTEKRCAQLLKQLEEKTPLNADLDH